VANTSLPSPYFREEHEALRTQLRRFVETEIKPHGLKWEEQGFVPREVLRRMGELGFLGIRYPAEYRNGCRKSSRARRSAPWR
jgi:acyl-CoA dehydrogenase